MKTVNDSPVGRVSDSVTRRDGGNGRVGTPFVPTDLEHTAKQTVGTNPVPTLRTAGGGSVSFSKLSDVADVIDSLHKTPQYSEIGKAMVRCTDVRYGKLELAGTFKVKEDIFIEFSRRYIPKKGDIVITRVGSYGITAYVEDVEFCLGQNTSAIVPTKIDAEFLYLALNSPVVKNQIESSVVGSTQKTLSLKAINNLDIPRFTENIEIEIAKIGSSLNKKIHLNRQLNQTLEQIAQAIFKSWFVDFEPVRAKVMVREQGGSELAQSLAAQAILCGALTLPQLATQNHNETTLQNHIQQHLTHQTGLHNWNNQQLQTTAELFPNALVESELGDVPEGWKNGVLGDICSFTAGSAFKPEYQGGVEGIYPFIKVSDMNLAGNEVFILSANNYVSKTQQSEMKAKLHPLGATVFAKIGVALISNRRRLLVTPTIIDNNMMSASPIGNSVGQYFLYSMLSIIDFNTLVSGTALPYLNVSDLKKISIVHPSHNAIKAFEEVNTSIFLMIQTLARQNTVLATTRDTLLPKLLAGEISLDNMDGDIP